MTRSISLLVLIVLAGMVALASFVISRKSHSLESHSTIPKKSDSPQEVAKLPEEKVLDSKSQQTTDAKWERWGGALQSARYDGAGFFDRQPAAAFAASVHPSLQKYVVALNSRALLPLVEEWETVFGAGNGTAVAYLQFADNPTDAQRARLSACGIELLSYVSACAWTARGAKEDFASALKLDFVRAAARIDPRDKLHPLVYAWSSGFIEAPERTMLLAHAGTTLQSLRTKLAESPELASAEIQPAAASVLGPRFELHARAGLLARVAELDEIAFIEPVPPRMASRDATTDIESNIGDVRDNPPNLNGSGIKVAVREIGKMAAHLDFSPRLQFVDSNGLSVQSNVDHATAVTGQIGSSGATQPSAKGVAPGVNLLAYALAGDANDQADIIDAGTKGARISNHSYGPVVSVWGDYRTQSGDMDNALNTNNLLAMMAGNEETGGIFKHIDYFAGAKNTICVSASSSVARAGNDSPLIPKTDGIAPFCEYGPMNDGRIKPDLVADGDSISLDQGTSSLQFGSGTSFACPVVSGAAALVFQQYKTTVGAEPSAATAKALLCNSASDLGQTGPDAKYGFGILNVKAAVATITSRVSAPSSPFIQGTIGNGGTVLYGINVSGFTQLKATLCWFDPAGNPAAQKALVNDLDLELDAPDGTVFFPYSLNPANPSAAATNTGPNRNDPIEQVVVNNPVNGLWTIKVTGTSVPVGPQNFAICLNHLAQNATGAPLINSPTSVAGTVGTPFSYTITSLGIAPINFSASALPAGLSLAGAVISGTPSAAGTTNVTLTATNTFGTDSPVLSIAIASATPLITSPLAVTAPIGAPFSYTVTATGQLPMTFAAAPLPAGLTFSGATISGTPTALGATNVVLTATNGLGSDTKTLVLTVANVAPTITSPLTASVVAGAVFSYNIAVAGSLPVTLGTSTLPAGLSLTGATISGTAPSPGTYPITLTATNTAGSDTKTLALTVNAPPVAPKITSSLTAMATVGVPFNFPIAASGTTPIVFTAAPLPPGLLLNGATILGTPMAAATLNVVLTATNAAGTDTRTLVLTVGAAPVFTGSLAYTGTIGIPFTFTPTAAGTLPIVFTATSLPAGVTFDGTVVSGTLAAAGTYNVTLGAANAFGTATKTLVISMNPPGPLVPPAITGVLVSNGQQNQGFLFNIVASGSLPIAFSATPLPTGLSVDSQTGQIFGAPLVSGATSVKLSVSNAVGSDAKTLVLTISPAPGAPVKPPPQFASPPATPDPVLAGQPVTLSASGTQPGGGLLLYTWDFGDGINGIGASVTHVYAAPGIYTATVTISDGVLSTSQTVNVAVNGIAGGGGIQPSAFIITKAFLGLKFSGANKDCLKLSGLIPLASGFIPAGKNVTLAVGAFKHDALLDSKGKAQDRSFVLMAKLSGGKAVGSPAKFTVLLKDQSLFNSISVFGFSNTTVPKPGSRFDIPVIISVDGISYLRYVTMIYTATMGKAGLAKKQ